MARCSNCKAPLPDGILTCAYCGEQNDVDLKGIHYYTTHQSDTPRICPRCDVSLKTIDLKMNGTFLIERCEKCLGLFFDPPELEALLDSSVANVFQIDRIGLDSINLHRAPDQYPVSYIKCPVCSEFMNRVNFGIKSGVIVDRCRNHGVWLDGGELNHLMKWMKMGGKLLDQERQEQANLAALKKENKKLRGIQGHQNPAASLDFSNQDMSSSHLYPDIITIISGIIRLFS